MKIVLRNITIEEIEIDFDQPFELEIEPAPEALQWNADQEEDQP